jgi:DNA-binding response OmpR family regulator
MPGGADFADAGQDGMMAGCVLLLEDDPALHELLAVVLQEEQLEVMSCQSPAEICSAAAQREHVLALVDSWGRSRSSLDPGEREEIRRLAATVPTIMVTAQAWAAAETAEGLGLLALIQKPFELSELTALVKGWIGQPRSGERGGTGDGHAKN